MDDEGKTTNGSILEFPVGTFMNSSIFSLWLEAFAETCFALDSLAMYKSNESTGITPSAIYFESLIDLCNIILIIILYLLD